MNKMVIKLIAVMIAGMVFLTACRPPDIEGTVLNIQKQLYDDALLSAEKAVQTNPENAEAWFYWGWLNAEQKKDYSLMNEAFDKALALNPAMKVYFNGTNVSAQNAIENYRGSLYANNFNSAVKLIPEAQQMEKGDLQTKKFEQALEKLSIAQQVSPERAETYRPMALTYMYLGDTTKAESAVEEMLSHSEGDEENTYMAGEIYSMIGKTDKAFDLFSKVIEMNPQNSKAYQKLGIIESNRKNWDEANNYYQKAMEMDPDNADLAFNIAVSYYNQTKLKEAIPFFLKSLEAEPDNENTVEVVGRSYVAAQMFDDALPFLEDAVDRFPENATLWEYLAMTYGQKGMTDKANDAFAKSKALKGE